MKQGVQRAIFKSLTVAIFAIVTTSIFWGYSAESDSVRSQTDTDAGKLIDIKANLVYPYKVNDTTSVLCLVGDFAAQHNGAVITADSAVRYDDDRLKCYGNALINKNTTYAYADSAEYDGANNIARLYSPIIKVIDQDITMYAYNFSFNTRDNVGYYWDGGVTTKEDDIMESMRGYYYADTKQVVGVDRVELRGEGYEMRGDSVIYEMEAERAHFFQNTNIWNEDGNYIRGDKGLYDKAEDLYSVTKSGYLLTREQEVWSDTMEYRRSIEEVTLRGNIQIDDTTNMVLAFGDYAKYWGDVERILLAKRPSVISYDTSQGDSLFMRGDSILMLSYLWTEGPAAEKAKANADSESDLYAELFGEGEETVTEGEVTEEVVEEETAEEVVEEETAEEVVEEDVEETVVEDNAVEEQIVEEQIAEVEPTKKELKEIERAAERAEKLTAYNVRVYRKLIARRDKAKERMGKKLAKGRNTYTDSLIISRLMGEIANTQYVKDSLAQITQDIAEEVADSVAMAQADSLSTKEDSLYRIVKVYRNAEIYRSDFQLSADSVVAISYDTTMQAHIKPVVWSDKNQIASDEMHIYTLDGALDYAEFFGKPVMSTEVIPGDTTYFNQVSGKEMVAYFVDNNIERNDVNGNVETIYFMQDEESGEVTDISKVEAGSASFFIKEQQLDGIIYRTDPTYVFAPVSKMPEDMSFTLTDFAWYGSRRPTRKEVFSRTLRPSRRIKMSMLPRPTFPIEKDIENEREVLQRRGEWTDRSEDVSEESTRWMQQLGFTPGEPRKEGESPF